MIKYFCDCCGSETAHLIKFEFLIHIEKSVRKGIPSFIMADGEEVSRRLVNRELCSSCYNRVATEAYKKFEEIAEASDTAWTDSGSV